MGALSEGDTVMPAKVKFEVKAEYGVDLLDYIPLAERQRMMSSGGRWDADRVAKHVSPRFLMDDFLGGLTCAVKPVSSLFTKEQKYACSSRNTDACCEQKYNVLFPGSRTAEILVEASVVTSGPTCSHLDICKSSPLIACSMDHGCVVGQPQGPQLICKPDVTELDTASSHFYIQVKFEPADTVQCSTDTRIYDYPSGSKRSCVSQLDAFSPRLAKAFEISPNLEIVKDARCCLENACIKNTGCMQKAVKAEPMEESIDTRTPEANGPKHSLMPFNDNPDSISRTTQQFSRSDEQEKNSAEPSSLHGSQADRCTDHQLIPEVRPSIVGQKRVRCAVSSKNLHPLLASPTSLKNKSVETGFSNNDSLGNSTEVCVGRQTQEYTECSLTMHHSDTNVPSTEEMQVSFDPNRRAPLRKSRAYHLLREAHVLESIAVDTVPEDSDNHLITSTTSSPPKVKIEPLEVVMVASEKSEGGNFRGNTQQAHMKVENDEEFPVDELDHVPLIQRMKILTYSEDSKFSHTCNFRLATQHQACAVKTQSVNSGGLRVSNSPRRRKRRKAAMDSVETALEEDACAVKTQSVNSGSLRTSNSSHRRKRRKTATDSVETALEEDAPELLQVLIEKGINMEEIKLYGSGNYDDMLDISSIEDCFEELENVISKIFSERQNSLMRLASLRDTKDPKAVYCLACLVSLIEQAQYLLLQNCPVEWGWCRDLQSFIFVFEKHNRVVLERPEYGYATYFFELVDSLPVEWQIKRLVTAMKVTNCSRITIIENKSLQVGEDLTEGEARVLEEYGWKPNTGIGSMLNFCDRVVHDRKNELSNSEWKSRIGKLLMNGYDGGRIVMGNLPKKVADYVGKEFPPIKLEL